ncbi:MAG: phosphoribosyl 1,2-cyclic phosphate phosphodiesterase [Verrucomicrobiales bacterium]|jgi:phosphoribosyl 1,2-cyclic phosphate phosphodiesterase
MGFDDLRRYSLGRDVTMPIYANAACLERLKMAFSFAFDKSNWYPGYIKPVGQVIDRPFELGANRITPLEVTHGKVDTIGFLFERDERKLAVYIPDCKTISESAMSAMSGVENLIIDATKLTPLPTHLNVDEALEIRQQLLDSGDGPQQTWLTHLAHDCDHTILDERLPDGVNVAYDGLKLNLG